MATPIGDPAAETQVCSRLASIAAIAVAASTCFELPPSPTGLDPDSRIPNDLEITPIEKGRSGRDIEPSSQSTLRGIGRQLVVAGSRRPPLVLLNNVEVLRTRPPDKTYIVEAFQQGDNSFALNKMVLALPASIELSPRALNSKGVMPSGARASWEVWHRRLDDRSRYTWAYFLKNKSDALGCFKDWMVEVERFTEHKVKAVRSDNGGEYTSKEFEHHLHLLGSNTRRLFPTPLIKTA